MLCSSYTHVHGHWNSVTILAGNYIKICTNFDICVCLYVLDTI